MSTCPTCNAAVTAKAQFCRSCGASLAPTTAKAGAAPVVAPPGPTDPGSSRGISVSTPVVVAVTVLLVSLVGALTLLVVTLSGGDDADSTASVASTAAPGDDADEEDVAPTTTEATTPPPEAAPTSLDPVSVTASSFSPGSSDCDGTVAVTYVPENVLDGRPDTAWQVGGDGTGQSITFDLGASTSVRQVGLVPGYDKVQPCGNRTDRFPQNFRVSQVRWVFDDGTSEVQSLDVSNRSMQLTSVDATTQQIRMEILATVPGTESDVDTPISDIQIVGVP